MGKLTYTDKKSQAYLNQSKTDRPPYKVCKICGRKRVSPEVRHNSLLLLVIEESMIGKTLKTLGMFLSPKRLITYFYPLLPLIVSTLKYMKTGD
jgi:hypothetical protein